MSRADAELGWYFGSASKTWQGDAGLRSPGFDGVRTATNGAIAAQRVEDAMLERCSAANMSRVIEAKLRCLSSVHVEALRLHYTAPSLPFSVDACAVMLDVSKRLVARLGIDGSGRAYTAARAAIATARDAAKAGSIARLHLALGAFLEARGSARNLRRKKGSLDLSTLRTALHEATREERQAIDEKATALVRSAIVRYESVEVDVGKSVQVRDPRPWKRD